MKYSEHARPSWIFKGNGFDKGYCRPNHPIIVPATGYKGHSGNGVYILHYRRINNKIIRNRNYQLHFALASVQQGINKKTPCKWTWDLILCRFTSSSFIVQPANISETQVLLEQLARYLVFIAVDQRYRKSVSEGSGTKTKSPLESEVRNNNEGPYMNL